MSYKLNLFRMNLLSGDWFFIGKFTPDEIVGIESNNPNDVYLSNGW